MTPTRKPKLPPAPRSIQAGKSLADLLGEPAVACLAHNLRLSYAALNTSAFTRDALAGLSPLGLMDRARHLARVMHEHLPGPYAKALGHLVKSFTPPITVDSQAGLEVFFYLPHSFFISEYGLDPANNGGRDPLDVSLQAQYELTRRFTAEFSIRPFLIQRQDETLKRLKKWVRDPDPQVRRWTSEGTRPRLPWGLRLAAFVDDPSPTIPFLEALKDDPELYVRRSVANHLGDIGKDHPDLAFEICRSWLKGASPERKWLIRHAVRYHAKRGHPEALELRREAAIVRKNALRPDKGK